MRLVTAAEEKVIHEDGFQICPVVILHIVSIACSRRYNITVYITREEGVPLLMYLANFLWNCASIDIMENILIWFVRTARNV